jgi:lactoylglutathione lyase
MAPKLLQAYGYQGDNMNLPVRDVDSAVIFYEQVLGFTALSREQQPKKVVLSRDEVQIALVENGGDPEQDGCAFHVDGIDELLREFISNGLKSDPASIKLETRDEGTQFRVFFVIAPDGLCFWFGERQK